MRVPCIYEHGSRHGHYLLLHPDWYHLIRRNPNWGRVPDALADQFPGYSQHRLSDIKLAQKAAMIAFTNCPPLEVELTTTGTPVEIHGYWK